MPATWVDRSSSRGEAAKYNEFQYFILCKCALRPRSCLEYREGAIFTKTERKDVIANRARAENVVGSVVGA
jgi:hypothetical protein